MNSPVHARERAAEQRDRRRPARTGSVCVATRDPDGLFGRATAGAAVVRGLEDQDYGSREFTVRDPEGVHWSFGTYAGAPVAGDE